jgi:hypothetical protein
VTLGVTYSSNALLLLPAWHNNCSAYSASASCPEASMHDLLAAFCKIRYHRNHVFLPPISHIRGHYPLPAILSLLLLLLLLPAAPLLAGKGPLFKHSSLCLPVLLLYLLRSYDNGITGGVISMRNFAEMFFVSHPAAVAAVATRVACRCFVASEENTCIMM